VLLPVIPSDETHGAGFKTPVTSSSHTMLALWLGVSGVLGRDRRPTNLPPGPMQVPVNPVESAPGYPPPPEGSAWARPPGYPDSDPWPPPPPPPNLSGVPEAAAEPVAVCGSCSSQVALEDTQCRNCGVIFEIMA